MHSDLMMEVFNLLSSRFKPDPTMIKKRIESLMEREYLDRVEGERQTYRYLVSRHIHSHDTQICILSSTRVYMAGANMPCYEFIGLMIPWSPSFLVYYFVGFFCLHPSSYDWSVGIFCFPGFLGLITWRCSEQIRWPLLPAKGG